MRIRCVRPVVEVPPDPCSLVLGLGLPARCRPSDVHSIAVAQASAAQRAGVDTKGLGDLACELADRELDRHPDGQNCLDESFAGNAIQQKYLGVIPTTHVRKHRATSALLEEIVATMGSTQVSQHPWGDIAQHAAALAPKRHSPAQSSAPQL